MYKNLRIIFTILSAICVAAVLPIGAFWQFNAAITFAAAAGVFYILMLICKQKQEELESKNQSTAPLNSDAQKEKTTTAEESVSTPAKKEE